MRLHWMLGVAVALATLWQTGCVTTLDGRQEAGVPFAKDKIESRYERPAMDIWTAAKDVLRANGTLFSEDLLKSTLQGSVNEKTVWIKVEELDKSVSRVTIQTRSPDLELAGELDKQIAVRLATGHLTPGSGSYKQPPPQP